jgi:hypothetical protein
MNPLILNIVLLERELEDQRQAYRVRRDHPDVIDPAPLASPKDWKSLFRWIGNQYPCRCSETACH